MNTKLLEKIDPAELIPAEVDLDGKAEYISKTLGYHVDTVARTNSDENTLLGILKEHGVKVFSPEGVEKYKAKYPKMTIRKERIWGRIMPFTFGLVASVLAVWAYNAAKSAGYWNGDPSSSGAEVGAAIGMFVLSLFAFFSLGIACLYLSDWNRAIRSTLERTDWVSFNLGTSRDNYRLDTYSNPIPKDVLLLAADLKNKSSKLGFTIEELHSRTTVKAELSRVRQRRAESFDPLLYVHYGNASFCIAQWDQPGWNVKHI
jgi:hypothetical protein